MLLMGRTALAMPVLQGQGGWIPTGVVLMSYHWRTHGGPHS